MKEALNLPNFLGNQYIIELYQCTPTILDDVDALKILMHDAAIAAGATVVQQFFHKFTPQGVSGTIVIAESHLNIHTWPEYGFAAVDIFTCGENLSPESALELLRERLDAKKTNLEKIKRGKDIRDWHLRN